MVESATPISPIRSKTWHWARGSLRTETRAMSALAMSSVSAFGAVAAAPQTRRDQRRPTPAVHVVRGGAPRATTSGSRQVRHPHIRIHTRAAEDQREPLSGVAAERFPSLPRCGCPRDGPVPDGLCSRSRRRYDHPAISSVPACVPRKRHLRCRPLGIRVYDDVRRRRVRGIAARTLGEAVASSTVAI